MKKGREVFILYLNSRELMTLVETIHLIGDCITLMMIISSQNLIEELFGPFSILGLAYTRSIRVITNI